MQIICQSIPDLRAATLKALQHVLDS